jgi:hypothetical protein
LNRYCRLKVKGEEAGTEGRKNGTGVMWKSVKVRDESQDEGGKQVIK